MPIHVLYARLILTLMSLTEHLGASSWSLEEVSQLMRPLNSIPAQLLPQE